MSRLVEQAKRERQAAEMRLADLRVYIAKLKTEAEVLTAITELEAKFEAIVAAKAQPEEPGSVAANDVPAVQATKAEMAEAFVLHAGRGVLPTAVAKAIGTTGKGASHALREVARTRGTVRYAGGHWYPEGKVPDAAKSISMLIEKAMADGKVLSTSEIHDRVENLAPGTNRVSVMVQTTRLRDDGVIEARGKDPHSKGYLYALKGVAPAAAAR